MKKSKNSLSTELIIKTPDGAEGRLHDLPAPVMQALYHQITGRREKTKQSFDGDFLIEKNSISNLIERLGQTLEQFSHKANSVEITIIHHNKDRQVCSSLEKFMQYDDERPDPIDSLNIDLSFLISAPVVGEYQSYKMSINIVSYILFKKDKYARYAYFGGRNDRFCIGMEFEYVDYVISRTFMSAIEEWVDSLETVNVFKLPKLFEEDSYRFVRIISYISSYSFVYMMSNLNFFERFSDLGGISLAIVSFLLLSEIIGYLLDKTESYIGALGYFTVININRGDKKNYDQFLRKRKYYNRLGSLIFGGVIVATLVNIFSSHIYDYFWG